MDFPSTPKIYTGPLLVPYPREGSQSSTQKHQLSQTKHGPLIQKMRTVLHDVIGKWRTRLTRSHGIIWNVVNWVDILLLIKTRISSDPN